MAGEGLSENIREAYGFLVNNYDRGDEIFLLGFSRGAFTARSIAGMINCVGLLTARGMDDFYPIFKDWENQVNPHYVSKWPERPFSNRPNITDVGYAQELESVCRRIPLKPCSRTDGCIAWSISPEHHYSCNRGVGYSW